MRRFIVLFISIAVVSGISACSTGTEPTRTYLDDIEQDNSTVSDLMAENCASHDEPEDYTWDAGSVVNITLNGSSISVDGPGVTVDGSKATITASGNYSASGALTDGQITIDTDDDGIVRLILNNADITCSTSAPINIAGAEKTIIILPEDTGSHLADGDTYIFDDPEDDEPNAALFSKDDLSFYGSGSLTIDANYNDGITSKDGLVINSGIITVDALDDGIRGKDYLVVKDGSIIITSGGDALKSDDDDEDKGYILIEHGVIDLTSSDDGIDAESDLLVSGGTITILAGGGSDAVIGEDDSAKGIKGNAYVVIDDCIISVDSADDAIHSNTDMIINGGDFTLASGDDAIHADNTLSINDGNISITRSFEGIEGYFIVFYGGNISVISSDDCVNSTAGARAELDNGCCTYIYGGYIVLNASVGDGIDSNGNIVMKGGTVIIHGPSNDPEVMFDYDGTFDISGGLIVGSGSSSHMTQAPSPVSTQNSVMMTFTLANSASTIFHIDDSDGNEIATFEPLHRYQSIGFSSPDLETGKTYRVYLGGVSTGLNNDGLITGGSYSGGSLSTTFTISEVVTPIEK
ncbi:MAG: carbohydrate-binding domain-containing protein [Candidatus Krumholzibacteriota bacterium]|nr:carbohydrate-binding domain-containing protein [Candidatus Krumholzibacteriota bacterium]